MDSKNIKIIILAAVCAVLFSILIAPFINSHGSITNLDGTIAFIDNSELWSRLDGFSALVYSVGDLVCHQQMARTFIVNGNEMPVCVRDLGIVIGIAAGMAAMILLKRYDRKKMILISICGLLLIFMDWAIQYMFTLNVPITRLITGITAGMAASILFAMLLDGTLTDKI